MLHGVYVWIPRVYMSLIIEEDEEFVSTTAVRCRRSGRSGVVQVRLPCHVPRVSQQHVIVTVAFSAKQSCHSRSLPTIHVDYGWAA
jgi:hypothetical protein